MATRGSPEASTQPRSMPGELKGRATVPCNGIGDCEGLARPRNAFQYLEFLLSPQSRAKRSDGFGLVARRLEVSHELEKTVHNRKDTRVILE